MYKAFVSSTYRDLAAHRARVVEALRRAGFVVDPMEMWTADADAPRTFSAERLRGCNVCILLIGFRRGHVPAGEERSITQIEYEEAVKQGIDVLPFVLDEREQAWDPAFDERAADPGVEKWREAVAELHGAKRFGADPASLEIEAALVRWVVSTEAKRASRFRKAMYAALAVVAATALVAGLYTLYAARTPGFRSGYLSRFLAWHDPVAFNNSKSGRYEIARVLDTLGTLRAETKLAEEIRATRTSFDLLANNAQYIRLEQKENLLDIVRRGGRVRIVLWDYSEPNRPAYDAFCRAIGQDPEETRSGAKNVDAELRTMRHQIAADRNQYPGSLDVRWNQKPLFYTMWLRDWDHPDRALAHLGVHFYQGQDRWPAFRVARYDGTRMLENMHSEFEHAWATSLNRPSGEQEPTTPSLP